MMPLDDHLPPYQEIRLLQYQWCQKYPSYVLQTSPETNSPLTTNGSNSKPPPTFSKQKNKENFNNFPQSASNSSILKKVRFESPTNQTNRPNVLINKPVMENNGNNFEQMYLANIPNRKLDLSVIDVPRKVVQQKETEVPIPKATTVENKPPKSYKEFLERQKKGDVVLDDSVEDIFNYKGNSPRIVPKRSRENLVESAQESGRPFNPNLHSPRNSPVHFFPPHNDKPETKPKPSEPHLISPFMNTPFPDPPKYHQSQNHRYVEPAIDNFKDSKNYVPLSQPCQNPSPFYTNPPTATSSNIPYPYPVQNYPSISEPAKPPKQCDCSSQTDSQALKLKTEEDVTTQDLLKIIAQQSQQMAQQNNQLMMLQQQVSELVLMQKQQISERNRNERCITSTQHEGVVLGTPKKQVQNFSIGLTTSYEVSFRRPPQRNPNFVGGFSEPKIQEITETESDKNFNQDNKTLVDASMVFKEPIKVRETCPSPEPTIKIDMNDFEDSESDEDSQVEATFYRNLMGQVNKILQKAQIQTAEELAVNVGKNNLNNRTMHKIKEATMKHLRTIGVEMPAFEDSTENSFSSSDELDAKSYNQEEISFAVKQLLMKYLPADHLSKLASQGRRNEPLVQTPPDKIGAIKNRPEFSFATVQYMKKYNLMANDDGQKGKILDISKLKQQPKLL